LTQARSGIAFGVIGAAMACYETALEYATTRIAFGKPIASKQIVQEKLVYMVSEITKMQLLGLRLLRMKEAGTMTPPQVSLAKRNNCHEALKIARIARDILGGNGIMFEYPIGRHMLNLETVITYEGTHDIHTLIIGQHITGIPAFE
jgi:glutaryl-CoA dehydrogenase